MGALADHSLNIKNVKKMPNFEFSMLAYIFALKVPNLMAQTQKTVKFELP